jgi:hypothetical protein
VRYNTYLIESILQLQQLRVNAASRFIFVVIVGHFSDDVLQEFGDLIEHEGQVVKIRVGVGRSWGEELLFDLAAETQDDFELISDRDLARVNVGDESGIRSTHELANVRWCYHHFLFFQ